MDNVRIHYLRDGLASLEPRLRQRAADILRHDDEWFECRIDQMVLQKARDRYRMSGPSIAFAEIAVIARALRLKLPR